MHLPALYSGLARRQRDGRLQLGQMTDWGDQLGLAFRGLGQKVLCARRGERARGRTLEVRSLELADGGRAMARGARADAAAPARVLDRLMAPPGPAAAAQLEEAGPRELAATVARDLDWLLNTKRWLPEELTDFPEANRSILCYGLPDLSTFSWRNPGDATAIARLSRDDPPLRAAAARAQHQVTPLAGNDADDFRLHFRIDAVLEVEPCGCPSRSTPTSTSTRAGSRCGASCDARRAAPLLRARAHVHPQAGRRVRGEVPRGRGPPAARVDGHAGPARRAADRGLRDADRAHPHAPGRDF